MNEKYIIIDDFYSDPDSVRKIAIDSEYTVLPDNNNNWSGNSTLNQYIMPGLDTYVSKRAGIFLRTQNLKRQGFFRKSYSGDNPKSFVHIDTPNIGSKDLVYTGIIYLTAPEYSKGKPGTNFYMHKPSGKHKVANTNDITLFRNEYYNSSLWELTDSIEMVYNRLLLIHMDYFHSPAESIGKDKINCTYKQIFSFVKI